MEMLEHVPDPGAILSACATLLKPGGRLFVSTLNRTPAAFALAIVGAEYVARLLPKGTHQYRDFIKPSELGGWLRESGLQLEDVSGVVYEPWRDAARLSRRTDVKYLACAVKPAAGNGEWGDGNTTRGPGIPARGAVRPHRHTARPPAGHACGRQRPARRTWAPRPPTV